MWKRAIAVKVLRPYVIEVAFSDGMVREIDLADELWGPVFEPLKDPVRFAEVRVDPDTGTVEWPNGADFAPEFIYKAGRIVSPARS